MNELKIDLDGVYNFIPKDEFLENKTKVEQIISNIKENADNTALPLGWVNLPSSIKDKEREIKDIKDIVNSLKNKIEVLVVIGVGGSYLGAKAVIEALSNNFDYLKEYRSSPHIIFAGHNVCEDYLAELVLILKNKSYGLLVISKSGTTLEPAITFRVLKAEMEKRFGKNDMKERIIVVTDEKEGSLRELVNKNEYRSFVIPNNIGGRFSVLTPVGLIPIAFAGIEIRNILTGTKTMKEYLFNSSFEENIAAMYATARYLINKKRNKQTEILITYNPKLIYFIEWWKQLFGESEGKDGKGIFPSDAYFTADLHSIGQFIQEGTKNIFETTLSFGEPNNRASIPHDKDNLDKLNYLSNKRISEINKKVEQSVVKAHIEGGVPNIIVNIPKLDEYYVGQLIYFFEFSCAISAYLQEVNPFDQPGVEVYKKNMFELLGK